MPDVVEILHSTLNAMDTILKFIRVHLFILNLLNCCLNLPVNGYHAAPLVMPLGKDGVPALQANPRLMVG